MTLAQIALLAAADRPSPAAASPDRGTVLDFMAMAAKQVRR